MSAKSLLQQYGMAKINNSVETKEFHLKNLMFTPCIWKISTLRLHSVPFPYQENLLDLIDTIKQMYQNPNKDYFDTIGILIQKF